MPKQQNRRAGRAGAQTAVKDRPKDRPKARQTAAPQGRTASSVPVATQSTTRPIVTEGVTWGSVNSYSVDSDRMMIKLNAGAINHLLVKMPSDSPVFRSAVSMTMLAYHTGAKLTIRYTKPNISVSVGGLEILTAQEIGLGADPKETLNFEDWPIDMSAY